MYIRSLALANFRSYRRLNLELSQGLSVFVGENGQGKSNLLEAVHVLATTRSLRASAERELINWEELKNPLAFARLEGRVAIQGGETHVEIVLRAQPPELDTATSTTGRPPPAPPIARTVRLNGLPSKAANVIGHTVVTLFSPEDVSLANGPPTGRRRYLDITCSQVSRRYLRALQTYHRVVAQRNALLRQIRDRRQPPDSIEPWNGELVESGSLVMSHRLAMVSEVNRHLVEIYRALSGGQEELRIAYLATILDDSESPAGESASSSAEALSGAYRSRLVEVERREAEQAVTLVGPHRDDFRFLLDGVDLNVFGSRGQQRLAVVALKLSEAEYLRAETGEQPILLLDDVLSELDPRRRAFVLERVANDGQTLLTTTATTELGPAAERSAAFYRVQDGAVSPIT